MTVYTNISKPASSNYSTSNPAGKEQYDQADITYDSATTFYDGVNPMAYTDISKPSSTAYINVSKPS